jgi:hypothetical protein
MTKTSPKKLSRRDAIKVLGAAAGATLLANLPSKWKTPELASGVLPAHAQTTPTAPPPPVLPIVTTDSIIDQSMSTQLMNFAGTVIWDGNDTVTARGFVWSTSPNPTLPTNNVPVGSGVGSFSSNGVIVSSGTIHIRAYATNSVGTAYGNDISTMNNVCLAAGTLVTLADGTTKPIEDIQYNDMLCVWNFDEGHLDAAQPLYIKRAEWTNQYNHLEFSDGSFLETINQHRIFNKEMGRFTYPMTEDTPIGTTTFNVRGEEVTLVDKYVVNKEVAYYNVITYYHMNLFGNGILTSVGYNNLYPIENMKFIKEERELISQEEYGLEDRFYYGLRLAEQDIPVADTIEYVNIRKVLEIKVESEPAL